MRCKICGDPIHRCSKRRTNNWCHYWTHRHNPIPDYRYKPIIVSPSPTIIQRDGIPAWVVVVVALIVIIVMLWK